jgi:hypothetical protein
MKNEEDHSKPTKQEKQSKLRRENHSHDENEGEGTSTEGYLISSMR